ncbi:MAG TPA: hypothetical protein VN821_09995 [Candidatus Udaeobacter sp.]|nr:hypothetical protein [Candidatus Udaeobacter sp.]
MLAGLWIGDRLLSPIRRFEDCRCEVQASLVVAFSLRDTVVRLAGKDDIEALGALAEACRDLEEEAERLEAMARRRSPFFRFYLRLRGYRLMQAVQGLGRLSESLASGRGIQLTERAAVEAALRLGPERRSGLVRRRSRSQLSRG